MIYMCVLILFIYLVIYSVINLCLIYFSVFNAIPYARSTPNFVNVYIVLHIDLKPSMYDSLVLCPARFLVNDQLRKCSWVKLLPLSYAQKSLKH